MLSLERLGRSAEHAPSQEKQGLLHLPSRVTIHCTKNTALERSSEKPFPLITSIQTELVTPTSIEFSIEITNITDKSLTLESISVPVAKLKKQNTSAYQPGWQSWSETALPSCISDLPIELHSNKGKKGPPHLPTEFPWVTVVTDTNDSHLLAGFTTAHQFASFLQLKAEEDDSLTLLATTKLEGIVLHPHKSMQTETILLQHGSDAFDLLQCYATRVNESMQATVWKQPITGWSSWYEHGCEITEAMVEEQIETISTHHLPLMYVQIDDGYQKGIGDWKENEKFPHGLQSLVNKIHEKGLKAGIWWAPFVIGEHSALFSDHPDWIIRDTKGNPSLVRDNWGQHIYALDITQKEVQKYLRQTAHSFVDMGFDLIKLDFLYAGALEGKREDPSKTSIEAYRDALRLIHQETEGLLRIGCGAPFLPSVGLVDAMRTSADTEFAWDRPADEYKLHPGLRNSIQQNLSHLWMHNRLWTNDPDAITTRIHSSQLTHPEVQTLITVAKLTGSMFVGDDLTKLEPERNALAMTLFPGILKECKPYGPFVNGLPSLLKATIEHNGIEHKVVALFNWKNEPATHQISSEHLTDAFSLYDVWEKTDIIPHSSPLLFENIPAHGVKLFVLREK